MPNAASSTPRRKATQEARPLTAAIAVAVSYFLGALFPIFPVFLGAASPLWSIVVGGVMVAVVTMLLSFMSGMEVRQRVFQNVLLVAVAVAVTYGLGTLVKHFWQISV